MEDERFREVIAIVANFSWDRPVDWYDESADGREPSAVRADYDKWRPRLRAFRRTLRRENFPKEQRAVQFVGGELRKVWWAEFRRAFSSDFPEWHNEGQFVEGDGSRLFRGAGHDVWWAEFRRAFRRDFPEWHLHSYEHPLVSGGTFTIAGDFVGNIRRLQDDLRRVWELASTKKNDEAKISLLRIKMQFSRSLKVKEENNRHFNGWEHDKRAWVLMVETLEWLQSRLKSLKVCENPKCHGRKYFFKVYNNQRYCHTKCGERAKVLRDAKRAPKKEPTKSEATIEKMRQSARMRWAKRRREERRKVSAPPKNHPDNTGGLPAEW